MLTGAVPYDEAELRQILARMVGDARERRGRRFRRQRPGARRQEPLLAVRSRRRRDAAGGRGARRRARAFPALGGRLPLLPRRAEELSPPASASDPTSRFSSRDRPMSIARSHLTRVLHLAVLLTVVDQLLTSLVMERPLPGEDPDWPFALHQQSRPRRPRRADAVLAVDADPRRARDASAAALPVVLGRAPGRCGGRHSRRLSGRSRPSGRRRRIVDALSSAVHGLGLLLATFLAMSGAVLVRPLYRHALWAHPADGA